MSAQALSWLRRSIGRGFRRRIACKPHSREAAASENNFSRHGALKYFLPWHPRPSSTLLLALLLEGEDRGEGDMLRIAHTLALSRDGRGESYPRSAIQSAII